MRLLMLIDGLKSVLDETNHFAPDNAPGQCAFSIHKYPMDRFAHFSIVFKRNTLQFRALHSKINN